MINSIYQIYLELALIINEKIYNDKKIGYYTHTITENILLKKLKEQENGSL